MRRTRTPRSRPSPKRCTCELTVAERHRGRPSRRSIYLPPGRAHRPRKRRQSRVGPRHGQGCRVARVGPAMRAAGGMRVIRGRPGAWPSSPRRFTARLAPVCSALQAQPPTPTAPCVPAPARLSGRPLPAWHSLPRAPHGTPAHGATAVCSCACVACAHRRRQRRRQPQRSRGDPQAAPR